MLENIDILNWKNAFLLLYLGTGACIAAMISKMFKHNRPEVGKFGRTLAGGIVFLSWPLFLLYHSLFGKGNVG